MTMNKKYIMPSVKVVEFNATTLLAGSLTEGNNSIVGGEIGSSDDIASKGNTLDFVGSDYEE